VRVGIKWVNDLYVEDKKVCGILTEATFGMECWVVETAVVGFGINITKPENGYPESLESIAAALTDRSAGENSERCRLIAATLDNFWEFYQNLPARTFLNEYRSRSIILGKDIYVLSDGAQRSAYACAIDNECRLVVQYENGETATLGSGEVSVKPASARSARKKKPQ